jgi:phosphomannomutase/phosphoglucomutase
LSAFDLIFREYDIRGRVNDSELNDDTIRAISIAFAKFLHKRGVKKVVVGYDNRHSSPQFKEVAVEALSGFGMEVFDIGLTISPCAYFAQHHLKARGVMMITASHNPNGWSGLKLGCDYSSTLGSGDLKELYGLLSDNSASPGAGSITAVNVRDAYIENILKRIDLDKKYLPKIVVDAGNGGTGLFAYELFQKLGCTVFQLNCDPDPDYPHYFPNPSELNALSRLKEMVTHPYIKADFGLAFDGDGDRLGVMNAKGESVWADRVLVLLAAALLKKTPGAKILFDVKCTQALFDVVEKLGGEPIMYKTGHSHIKSKMREVGAALAGERSGHIFYGGDEYYGFDDAMFAGAKLVELVSQSGKSLEENLGEFPEYHSSPEIKVKCADKNKYRVVDMLIKDFKEEYGGMVNDINGARVKFDDGWGLVRASSNLPELVLVFEGETGEAVRKIMGIFREKLSKYSEVSSDWENLAV